MTSHAGDFSAVPLCTLHAGSEAGSNELGLPRLCGFPQNLRNLKVSCGIFLKLLLSKSAKIVGTLGPFAEFKALGAGGISTPPGPSPLISNLRIFNFFLADLDQNPLVTLTLSASVWAPPPPGAPASVRVPRPRPRPSPSVRPPSWTWSWRRTARTGSPHRCSNRKRTRMEEEEEEAIAGDAAPGQRRTRSRPR